MKFWTITVAALAFAAVASAGTTTITSGKSITSSATSSIKPNFGEHGHGHGGGQCVPEPLTMFGIIPGVAMLLRKRKKAAQ